MRKKEWVTRDGRKIALSCMECLHLRRSLMLILRNKWRKHWAAPILAEINRRCVVKPKSPADKKTEKA